MSGFCTCPWDGSQVGPIRFCSTFVPTFLLDRKKFWVKKVSWWPHPSTGILSIFRRSSFQVPSPHCLAIWLRSPTLSPEVLSHLRFLGLSRGSPPTTPFASHSHSFSWPSGLSSNSSYTWACPLSPLCPLSLPSSFSQDYFPTSKWDLSILTWFSFLLNVLGSVCCIMGILYILANIHLSFFF